MEENKTGLIQRFPAAEEVMKPQMQTIPTGVQTCADYLETLRVYKGTQRVAPPCIIRTTLLYCRRHCWLIIVNRIVRKRQSAWAVRGLPYSKIMSQNITASHEGRVCGHIAHGEAKQTESAAGPWELQQQC